MSPRLPPGHAPSVADLAAIPWLGKVPSDYRQFLSSRGGAEVTVYCWTFPSVRTMAEVTDSFRSGGAPSHLIPIAHLDSTTYVALDPVNLVTWNHELQSATPINASFTEWLEEQLDEAAMADADDEAYDGLQREWTTQHVPFAKTDFGRQVIDRLSEPLRDVLLDLHLQYVFQPHVVTNGDTSFLGLLHFQTDRVGCWKCGGFNQPTSARCVSCDEALLLGTYADAKDLESTTLAFTEPFAVWVAKQFSLDAPQAIETIPPGRGTPVPKWARLTKFGGSRDPRRIGAPSGTL